MDGKNDSVRQLESTFGPLEIRVLNALWARHTPACVRDLQPQFPAVAYTTLMTTLDRLFRKGTLLREKNGRAFYYRPKSTQQELISALAGSTFATLLPGDVASRARYSRCLSIRSASATTDCSTTWKNWSRRGAMN